MSLSPSTFDDDAAALEAELIENVARKDLNPVEKARACATLVNECRLTHQQIADRVRCNPSVMSNMVRLLRLSDEILELLERGELSARHGRALLVAKDPEVRGELAREAVREGWSTLALEARARASNSAGSAPDDAGSVPNNAVPASLQARSSEQGEDLREAALNVARAWGDVLGVEVDVRASRQGGVFRVDVRFRSAEAALATAGWLGEAVSRARGADS